MKPLSFVLITSLVFGYPSILRANEPVLSESFDPGKTYYVDSRVSLTGELEVPVAEGKPNKKVSMKGESTIKYDERILPADGKTAEQKTFRIYQQIDFHRTLGDAPQEATLRREVSRLVVMRMKSAKVPFSLDGPLTWGEIDLLRTDIFIPTLGGLLPGNAAKPGDSWKVSESATKELTDMEVEEGSLKATYIGEVTISNRQLAHIRITGTLKGVNEDGPVRQSISGTMYFDFAEKYIAYLSIRGEQELLNQNKQVVGKIEGQYVMTRRPKSVHPDFRDETLTKLKLEPNDDNTLLLYENSDLGVKLLHSRRWRVGRVQGRQITLDESRGSGLLITIEPPKKLPTTDQFLRESKDILTQKKAKFLKTEDPIRLLREPSELDRFAFDVEMTGQRVLMDYYVARQTLGGAVFAARIMESDRDSLQREVERIGRSLVITRRLDTK